MAVRGWTEGGRRDHKGNGETGRGKGEIRGGRERPEGGGRDQKTTTIIVTPAHYQILHQSY